MTKTINSTVNEFEKNPDKHGVRKLSDLKDYFSDKKKVEEILVEGNPIIYETFVKKFFPIDLGLTVMHPGNIGGEFYFTKGHVHGAKTPEFYVLMEGSGLLLLQKGQNVKSVKLKKGKIAYIPEDYAHRLVNNSRKKMKVLTIYHEESKPNYGVKFKRRIFK